MAKIKITEDLPDAVVLVVDYARKNKDLFWISSLVPKDLEKNGLILDGNVDGLIKQLKKEKFSYKTL